MKLCCLWLWLVALNGWALERYDFSQPAMGTVFRLSLYAPDAVSAEKAQIAAFARVKEIEHCASDYEPESELSILCRNSGSQKISADMRQLLTLGQQFAQQTSGAFDVTSGHLSQLWRRSKRRHTLPDDAHLQRALSLTGWQRVKLNEQGVSLEHGTQLDLGGLAKGYAADAALLVLKEHGIVSAAVAASGDIAIGAAPPDSKGWPVFLRAFETEVGQDKQIKLLLHDCGVSTSGDLFQFIEISGQRYSHIINPKVGLGLTQRIACSVVAPNAATSDALATAMCVLGHTAGKEVLAKHYSGTCQARWVELIATDKIVERSFGPTLVVED
jgi:thiamine biosynthesis lipoprotein